MAIALTFRPMRHEVVVVMRGDKVAGTLRHYGAHKQWIVRVPGVLSPAANPGKCSHPNLASAKAAVLAADAGAA